MRRAWTQKFGLTVYSLHCASISPAVQFSSCSVTSELWHLLCIIILLFADQHLHTLNSVASNNKNNTNFYKKTTHKTPLMFFLNLLIVFCVEKSSEVLKFHRQNFTFMSIGRIQNTRQTSSSEKSSAKLLLAVKNRFLSMKFKNF